MVAEEDFIGRGVITITPSWRGAVVEEAADDGLLLGRDWQSEKNSVVRFW